MTAPRCPGCGHDMLLTEVSCFVCRVRGESRLAAAETSPGPLQPGERRLCGRTNINGRTASVYAEGGQTQAIVVLDMPDGSRRRLRPGSPGWMGVLNKWALEHARRCRNGGQ